MFISILGKKQDKNKQTNQKNQKNQKQNQQQQKQQQQNITGFVIYTHRQAKVALCILSLSDILFATYVWAVHFGKGACNCLCLYIC